MICVLLRSIWQHGQVLFHVFFIDWGEGQLEGQSSWIKSSDTFIKNKANQNYIVSDDHHMGNDIGTYLWYYLVWGRKLTIRISFSIINVVYLLSNISTCCYPAYHDSFEITFPVSESFLKTISFLKLLT